MCVCLCVCVFVCERERVFVCLCVSYELWALMVVFSLPLLLPFDRKWKKHFQPNTPAISCDPQLESQLSFQSHTRQKCTLAKMGSVKVVMHTHTHTHRVMVMHTSVSTTHIISVDSADSGNHYDCVVVTIPDL